MTATRVDITDVESYASMAWDLGFKRTVIRANGGDSGPAGVRVSSVAGASPPPRPPPPPPPPPPPATPGPPGGRVPSGAGASLAAVTAVPDPSTFTEDDWADLSCTLVAGLLGEPFTAMGSWYDYNQTTHMVAPMAVVS